MDPNTLDMVGGRNSSRARHTLLSVVHTYTYDKPGMYNMADVDAYRNKINTGDWHCSVHVRELKSGESTDVCRHQRSDGLNESAIITVEPKSLTFIHTIRRPSTDGEKPGGAESLLSLPPYLGLDGGLPLSGSLAGVQADSAVMHAQEAILRAQMAAVRPEMLADMAEVQAELAANKATLYADLAGLGEDARSVRLPADQERALRDTRRQIERMRISPPAPPVPAVRPAVPRPPESPRP